MPAAPAVPSTQETRQHPRQLSGPSTRLTSLDLFRGITIAAMILVNNPGDESSLLATGTCRMEWLDPDRSRLSIFPLHRRSLAGLLFRIPPPARRFEAQAAAPRFSPRSHYLRHRFGNELQRGSGVSRRLPACASPEFSSESESATWWRPSFTFMCGREPARRRCRACSSATGS